MARTRSRSATEMIVSTELPVVYCKDDARVQAFVAARMRAFDEPETARDVLDAAVEQFGLMACFWFEIRLH